MKNSLKYKIALSLIPNIGDIRAKRLVAYCGSVDAVFEEKKSALEKIPGIGSSVANDVLNHTIFDRAEEEILFIEKNNITPLFYLDKNYPKRLTHCEDSPILLYFKGNTNLNAKKTISIVGTRDATDYGKTICEKLIADLAIHHVTIVSGLAYGIDICAHRAALENNLPTICALAHGLDKMYPSVHKTTAEKMLENGGWLSDFTSKTIPDRENFPRRNRIVAGISDATIVIESKKGGGSLITANIANSYNRDVFAFPGKVNDVCSEGCNNLIKQNKAALIQSAADIVYILGWEESKISKNPIQKQLFVELKAEEEILVTILKENNSTTIDDLCFAANMPMSKVSALLLTLEFSGIVKSLHGKMYKLN
ncbi:MAG: DNA protecting protein DprA [Bacteroidetes bacterium RIFCSPLOWO2_12_FULL_31_6]|nr:MAG: DNA protecting protein DprA [Bacteroidetes bacterium RIFCSPLOWO2_12_FULL_31_6]